MPADSARPPRPGAARGTWSLRDRPGVLWLLLALVVAATRPPLPHADWLLVHLVMLGALTHSVMVWSSHFSQTLLRSPPTLDDRTVQSRRLLLLLAGTTLVLVGVPSGVWPLTVAGALAVGSAVLWHAVQLVRRLRVALPGRFRGTVHHYVVAACFLPAGATFGALLARHPGDPWHGRLLVAHVLSMVVGWLGITVTGTLVTLWPTMLRARIDDRADRLARQSLPVLALALVVADAGALAGQRWVVVAALVAVVAGLGWWGRALPGPLRRRPPRSFAPLSVGAALVWYVVALLWVAATVALDGVGAAEEGLERPAAVFVVGFALQLLTGALTFLLPSVLGGGPRVVRAGHAWLERGTALRLGLVNGGLLVWLLPVGPTVRTAAAALVVAALAAFVPLMLGGIRAAVAARREVPAAAAPGDPVATTGPAGFGGAAGGED